MQDFSRLLQRLADGGFEFVIVGGFAALTHGSSLITRDLDVCAVLTDENVEKLRSTLADWHPKHRMTPQRLSFLEHPLPGTALQNLYLQTDVGIIDILSSISGVGGFERLKKNAVELEVNGRTYRVISLEDLIAAKEAVGREKDLLAVKELRAIAAKRAARGS
jgi:predicted nucleotidyltransferase